MEQFTTESRERVRAALKILLEKGTEMELKENPDVDRGERRRFTLEDLDVIHKAWNDLDSEVKDLATRAFPEIAAFALCRKIQGL